MRLHPLRLSLVVPLLAALCAAEAPPPADWIDARTGHRVIRLSPDTGGGSLYFHQRAYTPEGDKVILRTREGIMAVDLSHLGREAPRRELILPKASPIATAWRTREVYFFDRAANSLRAVHVDTRKVRDVVRLPNLARGTQFAVNCDESELILIGPDPEGRTVPRTPPSGGAGGTLEAQWAAGTPKMISSIDIRTGSMRVLHRENDWTNHLQCSPTDPRQILFCHEGPWHFTNRTWTLRTDGGAPCALHRRTMNMEIWGHEFFSQDGSTVWFDLQTPRSAVFWLAGVELSTGRRTWYSLRREEWSVHYNVSPDGKLFAGDGGGAGSVAAYGADGEKLDPPGNGQWIYLFRPAPVRGRSPREGEPLIEIGVFKSERLVDMSAHDYSKDRGVEPNVTFTPDGRWIVFSGNFHSQRDSRGRAVTHAYAVEVARGAIVK